MVFRLKRKKRPPLASVAANASEVAKVGAPKRPRHAAQAPVLPAQTAPAALVAVAPRKRKGFAPPRRKVVAGGAAFGSLSGSAAPTLPPVEEKCFEVLFCKRSSKKHKIYDDGFLVVGMGSFGKGACLYSSDGKVVRMMNHFGTSLEFLGAGSEFDCGTKEVEIVGEVSMSAFSSGTLFMGGAGCAPIAAAAAPRKLKSAAFRAHRPGTGKGGARSGGGGGVGHRASGSASGGALSTRPPIKARHDPDRPDAILVEAVSARDAANAAAGRVVTSVAVVLDPGLAAKLNPHQVEAVRSMWQCIRGLRSAQLDRPAVVGGCILAHAMGLGKTLSVLALMYTALYQVRVVLAHNVVTCILVVSVTDHAPLRLLPLAIQCMYCPVPLPLTPHSPPQSPTSHPLVKRCVIVTPVSLVLNWKAEIKKWLPATFARTVSAVTLKGSEGKRQVRDFVQSSAKVSPVLILGYETFRQHVDILCGAKGAHGRKKLVSGSRAGGGKASTSSGLASLRGALLVCDEGHRLKNAGGNQTTKALNRFPSHRRILVTGTPLQNKLLEYAARTVPVARMRSPARVSFRPHARAYLILLHAPLHICTQLHCTQVLRSDPVHPPSGCAAGQRGAVPQCIFEADREEPRSGGVAADAAHRRRAFRAAERDHGRLRPPQRARLPLGKSSAAVRVRRRRPPNAAAARALPRACPPYAAR